MTRKTVIELAKQAGPLITTPFDKWCENFAALVRNAALEEAVAVLEFHGFDDAVPYINWAKANPKEKT